jgi:hypothetical protein
LEEEAQRQTKVESQRIAKLEEVFKEISLRTDELEQTKKDFEENAERIVALEQDKKISENRVTELENEIIENAKKRDASEAEKKANELLLKQENWTNKQVQKWRQRTWIEFGIEIFLIVLAILYVLFIADWSLTKAKSLFIQFRKDVLFSGIISIISAIFFGFTLKSIYDKYRNHSNIQNFIKGLRVPTSFNE